MALENNVITPIPNNDPDAVPSLWNTRYTEIDANFQGIDERLVASENELLGAKGVYPSTADRLAALAAAIGINESDIGSLEINSTVLLSRAVRLDWLYDENRTALELWAGDFTLIDLAPIPVISALASDDTIDINDTANIDIDGYYVIFDDVNRESFQVKSILTGNRIITYSNLINTYSSTASIAKTSLSIANGEATAVINDTYYSKEFNLGTDSINRAVVIRKTDNTSNIKVWFRDTTTLEWTRISWSWKRTGGDIPDGFIDVEYDMPSNNLTTIKVVVEDEGCVISHIVGVSSATQLNGTANVPETPVNDLPVNGATNIPESPTLYLKKYYSPAGSNLTCSNFQIATTANGFDTPFLDSGDLTDTLAYKVPLNNLTINTVYWFRARVKDLLGFWSDWSAPTSFTTEASYINVVTPDNVLPAAGANNQPLALTLTSSAFSVQNDPAADTHASSRWQIRVEGGDYVTPVWDSGVDTVNLLSIIVPESTLTTGEKRYFFRVMHTGAAQGDSEWSTETVFSTIAGTDGLIASLVEDTTPQLGGDLDNNGKTSNGSSYRQIADASPVTATTHTLDYSAGDMQQVTCPAGGTLTISYSGFVSGKVCTFILDLVNGGNCTITYPLGTLFAGGAAPTLTVAGIDRLVVTKDKDNVYSIVVAGADIKAVV